MTTLLRWSPLVLVALAVALSGAGRMFSTFRPYDDEGYMHYAINGFAAHGGLYENVDSQYGPFFHVAHHALHALGLPFNANGGRLLMLAYWLATVGFCGATVWRLTRSLPATVFALGAVFLHLTPFVNDPTHPGGMVATLVAALAWIGARWPDRSALLAAAAGAIGAALLFTKINVGLFACAGAGAWWLLHLDARRPGAGLRAGLAGALLAALPFALMAGKLAEGWAVAFAAIVACAAAGVILAAGPGARPIARGRDLAVGAGAGAAVAALSILGVLARDTSLAGIFRGMVLDPARHPELFAVPVRWQPGALPLALLSAAWAAWAAARPGSPAMRRAIAAGRLGALLAFAVAWAFPLPVDSPDFVLSYGLAFAWLFVFPLGDEPPRADARAWIALLLVPQALHAYPVAGDQVSWGTFLWIPLAIGGAHEALGALGLGRRHGTPRVSALAAAAALALTLWVMATMARYGRNLILRGDPLGLPGATWVRLNARQASALRTLTLNARAHGDVLFSFPGLLSFNHWSGVPAPSRHNNTHWFTLLSAARQEEIRAALERAPRSVVIFQHDELADLARRSTAIETPLSTWLRAAYEPAFRIGGYEFRVRRGRAVAPLGTALARAGPAGRVITATLAPPAGPAIAAAELHRFKGIATEKIARWNGSDLRLAPAPASATDEPGALQVEFAAPEFPPELQPADAILYFTDAEGRRVAEARLL